MPTSEELKYFVALRDVIAGKMGDVDDHDRYLDLEFKRDYGGDGVFSAYFLWKYGGIPKDAIPLSLPIDPENPERGLVGMIDGTWFIQKWDESDYSVTVWVKKKMESFVGTTLTLALLKALAWQEGIEVTD